ncbi:MAG: DUF58 domain-containing protein [Cytophagales bacterium]|nr:DUF58 domain-containing protein [Cytophagales bacterium]
MKGLRELYFRNRMWWALAVIFFLFILAYVFPAVEKLSNVLVMVLLCLIIVDCFLLFFGSYMDASRCLPKRLSNGDENAVRLVLKSRFSFPVSLEIIDELPEQLQVRDFSISAQLQGSEERVFNYSVRPVSRGVYSFGKLYVFAWSPLSLVCRRFTFDIEEEVPCYPSYVKLRQMELASISNRLQDYGIKKIRKAGQAQEFENIREYVPGDDVRTLNWKATARRGSLMLNQFQEERSQPVYQIIDLGRTMKMPFNGLTLLDYAINSALVLSHVAINKFDRAGVMSFSHREVRTVKADRRSAVLGNIQDFLYRIQTEYLESDFEKLYITVQRNVKKRSLFFLYTNFESFSSLQRNLRVIRAIARKHLVVVVFFENEILKEILNKDVNTVEETYDHVLAEKICHDKKKIVKELGKYGIQAVYTSPEQLSVNMINKYVELKAKNML